MSRRAVDWPTFWGAALFLVIGGGFAVFGGWQLLTTRAFLADAVPVTATVVERHESCDDDGCTWWPTVELTDPGGTTHRLRPQFGSSEFGWSEGEEIAALWNPAYAYVRIPGAGNLWLLGGAFFAIGLLPAILGVWLLARWTFGQGSPDP